MIISVCGKEKVSVFDEGTPEDFFLKEGGKTETNFEQWFESEDEANCPIISYTLQTLSKTPLSES